jgi:transcriptional regulator with XRE-family HTH domain
MVELGYSQTELAKKAGLWYPQVTKYLNGIHEMRTDNVECLLEALGIEIF